MKKLKEVFFVLATLVNYTILGVFKMTLEAIVGKTLVGDRKLTMVGRLNHLVVQGTNVTAYYWLLTGRFKEAGVIYAVSWLFDSTQYYPEILGALSKILDLRGLIKVLDKSPLAKVFFVVGDPGQS